MNPRVLVISQDMPTDVSATPIILAISLKMYFSQQETIEWCRRISQISMIHPAASKNLVKLIVLPSSPSLGAVKSILQGAGVALGAQNLFHKDKGPYTGEVGGKMLSELGCSYVEIGHAERRQLFSETDEEVAEKLAAAVRNNLVPILCVGEQNHGTSKDSAQFCIDQIISAVQVMHGAPTNLLVAYEPVWAIGAEKPASSQHIIEVSNLISLYLDSSEQLAGSRVIYGGSAGPGLLTELEGEVAGLFLGRFGHDPENIIKILDEVSATMPEFL
jgi:triosephosphate isomerase